MLSSLIIALLRRSAFLFGFLIILSCSENGSDLESYSKNLSVSFDKTDAFELNPKYLSTYNYGCCLQISQDTLLVGYNKPNQSIDILNTKSLSPVKQVHLDNEGPNYVGTLRKMNYINDSLVLMLTQRELVVGKVNESNKIIVMDRFDLFNDDKHPITNFDYDRFKVEVISNSQLLDGSRPKLPYDSVNHRVYIRKYSTLSDNNLEYFTFNLGGWINLSNGSYSDVNSIMYPDFIRENGANLPFLYKQQVTILPKGLIYGFAVTPEIFLYEPTKNKDLVTVTPELKESKDYAKPISDFSGVSTSNLESTRKALLFFEHSAQHFPIVWDKYRKLYYRISKTETNEEQKDYRGHRIRRFGHHYLSIFNQEFDVLTEVKLPVDFDARILITQNSVLFPLKDPESENSFKLGQLIFPPNEK